jgi:DNA-binding LacI/PurR family transcriptional regulator
VLDDLQEQGLIYKVQGKGCFVADPLRQQAAQCRTVLYADTWGNLAHPHYVRRMEGMMMEAEARQLRLEVLHCGPRLERRERVVAEVQRPEVVGLIAPWVSNWLYAQVRAVRPHLRMVATASATPPLGVSSVGIDFAGIGAGMATYLHERGAGRLHFVLAHPESELGIANMLHDTDCTWQIHRASLSRTTGNVDLAQALAASDADGVGFDDEVIAADVLARWANGGMPVISHSSGGSAYLPAGVARLEIDGTAVGRLIMQVICGAIGGGTEQVAIQLRPTLITPRHEA